MQEDIQEIFSRLKDNYKLNLREKKNELEDFFTKIQNDDINIELFHQIIHKLAGGSGVYGFLEISKAASCIEEEIINKNFDKTSLLNLLNELISKINQV